jgi:hypothetical protein
MSQTLCLGCHSAERDALLQLVFNAGFSISDTGSSGISAHLHTFRGADPFIAAVTLFLCKIIGMVGWGTVDW